MPQKGMEDLLKIADESQKTGSKAALDLLAMQCKERYAEATEGRKKLKQEMNDNIKAAGNDTKAAQAAKSAGEAAIEKYVNSLDPFYKPYCLAFQMADKFQANKNTNWKDPNKCAGEILDSIDVPVEEKLQLLYIMRENARENLYPSGMNVTGEEDLKRIDRMANYQEKFGIGKKLTIKEEDGSVTVKMDDDIFAHNHGNMNSCFMVMFNEKYKKETDKSKVKREESMDIASFCDMKIREYHLAILSGKIKTGNQPQAGTVTEMYGVPVREMMPDPYFSGATYQQNQRAFAEKETLLRNYIMSDEGRKEYKDTKLFGRGSSEYDQMQESYKSLQEAIKKHTSSPSAETLKSLEEQAKQLEERANMYLGFKQQQIDSGKIKGKKTPDGKGGFIYQAENKNTQKRMEFARNLKKGIAELHATLQKSPTKAAQQKAAAPAAKM